MTPRLRSLALSLLLAAGAASAEARPTPLLGDGASADIVREINEFRSVPDSYVPGLPISRPSIEMGYRYSEFERDHPVDAGKLPSLTESDLLDQAAQQQADFLGAGGLQGHAGEGGSTPGGRLRALGWNATMTAEELSFGQRSPADVVRQLVIDAGVTGAPHRHDLMNPVFVFVGAGCAPHRTLGTVCVVVLSTRPVGGAGTIATGPAADESPYVCGISYRRALDLPLDPEADLLFGPPSTGTAPVDGAMANLFGIEPPPIPIPDLVLAGVAFRPSEAFAPEVDINWANWSDFDTLEAPPPSNQWVRPRLIGGDYGLEAAPAPYTPRDDDVGADDCPM